LFVTVYTTVTCQLHQYSRLPWSAVCTGIWKNDTSSNFDFFIDGSYFYVKLCVLLSH